MKRILAIFLAAFMLFALAACGEDSGKTPSGGTDKPDASQQGGKTDKKSWPTADFITSGMEYTGAGEITFVQKGKTAALGGTDVMLDSAHVYINGGDWDSIKAYVDTLKADGFSWYNSNNEVEPAFEFNEYGFYRWEGEADGGSRFILLNFYKEDKDSDDEPYNLEILMLNGNMHAK